MFMEIVTRRKEIVSININQIVYVTPDKSSTVIVDSMGQDYYVNESYDSIVARIKAIVKQNS